MRRVRRPLPALSVCQFAFVSCVDAQTTFIEVPFLEVASAALSSAVPAVCAKTPTFDGCAEPWAATDAWRYAAANVLAASAHSRASIPHEAAAKVAGSTARFFAEPTQETLAQAAESARALRHALGSRGPWLRVVVDPGSHGLGVPFPVSSVLVPIDIASATMQLKSGRPMPLLAFAAGKSRPPPVAVVAEAIQLGVRHFEVAPATAWALGRTLAESGVPRKDLFLSVPWELPLHVDERFDELLAALGTDHVDLLLMPRGPDLPALWRRLTQLKASGRVLALGVRDLRLDEIESLPGGGAGVEVAQCAFTPYRHGPSRDAWRQLGVRSIAVVASSLLSGWPHALAPADDAHVVEVALRSGRSAPQVLLRWALQLGLAVVFRTASAEHVAENIRALEFELPDSDMRLLSGLATLAEPQILPGDGFVHVYFPRGERDAQLRQSEL